MSLEIKDHNKSKRIKLIKLKEQDLEKIIFPLLSRDIQSVFVDPLSTISIIMN